MAVNKVVLGGTVQLDLTVDTVTAETLCKDVTAHNAAGEAIVGLMEAGGGIDPVSKPQVTFDGKWSGWYAEFYAGEAYWEAVFQSSGTLRTTGSYAADLFGIGGGGASNHSSYVAGCGFVAMVLNQALVGAMALTIGAGAQGGGTMGAGGSTTLGPIFNADGGAQGTTGNGPNYRFSDTDKAGEAGEEGSGPSGMIYGRGGWMNFASSNYSGRGYGAGGCDVNYVIHPAHSGALVIRIRI